MRPIKNTQLYKLTISMVKFVGVKKRRCNPQKGIEINQSLENLGTLSTETTGQLNVLGLDGNTLCVNGSQVRVLEKTSEVSLRSLLQSTNGRGLEAEISLEVLSNLTDETLEGELSDQKLSRLLVTTNFTESNGTWAITVGLLHTSGSWRCLTCRLGGHLLTGSLSSGGLAGSLLGSCHFEFKKRFGF